MELISNDGGGPRQMTRCDLHQISWRAGLLGRAAFMALGHEALRWDANNEAQEMLEHLWALGFRPSEQSDPEVVDVK